MNRRLLIKVCGMRDLVNLKEIAALAPDYLGFIFVPATPRYVTLESRAELLQSVPATIRTVGVFRNVDLESVEDAARRYRLSAVQLHGAEDSLYISECKKRIPSCQIFKAINVSESGDELVNPPKGADLYIFDGLNPGSGESFNWEQLGRYKQDVPFFLAGGVGPENIAQINSLAQKHRMLFGVDVNSKVEIKPGFKSPELVKRVFEQGII